MNVHRDYSGTPLWKKLGIKKHSRVALVDGPTEFARALSPLPAGVSVRANAKASNDVIVFFVTRSAVLARRFGVLKRALDPAGGLWIAYPKKSSGTATDVTFESVQRIGLAAGLVDNKSCSIDETWSALRFVVRLADRPASDRPRSERPGTPRPGRPKR